jgi:hypothetical protein
MVSDDVAGPFGRDQGLPACVRWRREASHRIVVVTDQPGCARQAVTGFEQAELLWPGHGARDEGQHLPSQLINAQRLRCALKATAA